MAKQSENKQVGGGFLGLLTLIFITLKLTGVIAWSWWWVLAPLWIPVAVFFGILAVWGAVVLFLILIAALCGIGTIKKKFR